VIKDQSDLDDEDLVSNSLSCYILSQVIALEEDNKSSQSLVSSLDVNEEGQNIDASMLEKLYITE